MSDTKPVSVVLELTKIGNEDYLIIPTDDWFIDATTSQYIILRRSPQVPFSPSYASPHLDKEEKE